MLFEATLTGALDIAWPDGPKVPDSEPLDAMGHGTHVAGIVAGKSEW